MTLEISESGVGDTLTCVTEGRAISVPDVADGVAEETIDSSVSDIDGSDDWSAVASGHSDADGESMIARNGGVLAATNTGVGSTEMKIDSLANEGEGGVMKSTNAPSVSPDGEGSDGDAVSAAAPDSSTTEAAIAESVSEISPKMTGALDLALFRELSGASLGGGNVRAAPGAETIFDVSGAATTSVGFVREEPSPAIDRADSLSSSGVPETKTKLDSIGSLNSFSSFDTSGAELGSMLIEILPKDSEVFVKLVAGKALEDSSSPGILEVSLSMTGLSKASMKEKPPVSEILGDSMPSRTSGEGGGEGADRGDCAREGSSKFVVVRVAEDAAGVDGIAVSDGIVDISGFCRLGIW